MNFENFILVGFEVSQKDHRKPLARACEEELVIRFLKLWTDIR